MFCAFFVQEKSVAKKQRERDFLKQQQHGSSLVRGERETVYSYFYVGTDETELAHTHVLLGFMCNPALVSAGQLELRMQSTQEHRPSV